MSGNIISGRIWALHFICLCKLKGFCKGAVNKGDIQRTMLEKNDNEGVDLEGC